MACIVFTDSTPKTWSFFAETFGIFHLHSFLAKKCEKAEIFHQLNATSSNRLAQKSTLQALELYERDLPSTFFIVCTVRFFKKNFLQFCPKFLLLVGKSGCWAVFVFVVHLTPSIGPFRAYNLIKWFSRVEVSFVLTF